MYELWLKSFQVQSVMGTKTTKTTRSFNQNENEACLVSNPYSETKQIRTKTCQVWNKNLTKNYCNEKIETKQSYDKKRKKIGVEYTKGNGNCTSIYTPWAFASK